jgi:phage terminase large subunit-like protein
VKAPLLDYKGARAFSRLSAQEKRAFIGELSDAEALQLQYTWEAWARDKQLPPPGGWRFWLMLMGRGAGKTRAGAEWIRKRKEKHGRIGLIGRTAADVRDVMVEGESGIMAISPSWDRPTYQPTKRRLVWDNGAQATTFSADEPDALRGPQYSTLWLDEPGAYQYQDAFDQAMFGLRLGNDPRAMGTTTPRVTPLIRRLIKDPTTYVTVGTTYENRDNLAPAFFDQIIRKYEGTRLGRQELLAEMLEDVEGALWDHTLLDLTRVRTAPEMIRVVVGVDPAVTNNEGSDETGIVVAGLGVNGHFYVLADYTLKGSPLDWAKRVVYAYYRWQADRVIGEVNNGGDLVEVNLRTVDVNISYKSVHATRGKQLRAEPIVSLYEQHRAHHVGFHAELEDEQCTWEPGKKSPNRLDGVVWALTELSESSGSIPFAATGGGVTSRDLITVTMHESEDEEVMRRQEQIARFLQSLPIRRFGI